MANRKITEEKTRSKKNYFENQRLSDTNRTKTGEGKGQIQVFQKGKHVWIKRNK